MFYTIYLMAQNVKNHGKAWIAQNIMFCIEQKHSVPYTGNMRIKYAFYALSALVFLLSSCTKNLNQPYHVAERTGYVPLAHNQDFMPDETRNFGERAETEYIGDMYIGDFKIIADSISLNHEQFRSF